MPESGPIRRQSSVMGVTSGNTVYAIRKQDFSAPVEKDSSTPRHFGTIEKKCQIGTAFSFKQT
jgi:hypothetical protein